MIDRIEQKAHSHGALSRRGFVRGALGLGALGIAYSLGLEPLSRVSAGGGRGINLCSPISWGNILTEYPAGPVGQKSTINETLPANSVRVITGGEFALNGISFPYLGTTDRGKNRLVAAILYAEDQSGMASLELPNRYNIRRDLTNLNLEGGITIDERDALMAQAIRDGRQFQDGETFRLVFHKVGSSQTLITQEMSEAEATQFINTWEARSRELCTNLTPTATATARPSATATPSPIPTQGSETKCPVVDFINGWGPIWVGEENYPQGTAGQVVSRELSTNAGETSAVIAGFLGYEIAGQRYALTLDNPNEIAIALFVGGANSSINRVDLRAGENLKVVTKNPNLTRTLTPEETGITFRNLILKSQEIKRREGRSLERVNAVLIHPDGNFISMDLDRAEIDEFVDRDRAKYCLFSPIVFQ